MVQTNYLDNLRKYETLSYYGTPIFSKDGKQPLSAIAPMSYTQLLKIPTLAYVLFVVLCVFSHSVRPERLALRPEQYWHPATWQ